MGRSTPAGSVRVGRSPPALVERRYNENQNETHRPVAREA
jgi:hypothetical protein